MTSNPFKSILSFLKKFKFIRNFAKPFPKYDSQVLKISETIPSSESVRASDSLVSLSYQMLETQTLESNQDAESREAVITLPKVIAVAGRSAPQIAARISENMEQKTVIIPSIAQMVEEVTRIPIRVVEIVEPSRETEETNSQVAPEVFIKEVKNNLAGWSLYLRPWI